MNMTTVAENSLDGVYDKWDMVRGSGFQTAMWERKEVTFLNTGSTHQKSGFNSYLNKTREAFAQACGGPDYYDYTNKEFCLKKHKSIGSYCHPVTGYRFKLCEELDCIYSVFRVRQCLHYGRDPFPGGFPSKKTQ